MDFYFVTSDDKNSGTSDLDGLRQLFQLFPPADGTLECLATMKQGEWLGVPGKHGSPGYLIFALGQQVVLSTMNVKAVPSARVFHVPTDPVKF